MSRLMLSQKIRIIRSLGVASATRLAVDRLLKPSSPALYMEPGSFEGRGLEVGGPSRVFAAGGFFPVYALAASIDNVNFRATTEWHGTIDDGSDFVFDRNKPPGIQYIRDAGALDGIPDASYDFVLSSHMLEHSANPLRVLNEWMRVLRPGGHLELVLPHRDGTFDHRRPVTPLAHFQSDFARDVGEDDRTHLGEILELHDLSRDTSQPSVEAFRRWIDGNFKNRGAHHHVFTSRSAARLLDAARLQLIDVLPRRPYDIFVTARKPAKPGDAPDNTAWLADGARYLRSSPFPSDRRSVG